MKAKTAFTKRGIFLGLTCTVLLLINVGAIGIGGRERAKRAVCLANLKQLTLAWMLFADDNSGSVVNGATGMDRPSEPPWVGRCWSYGYSGGEALPKKDQIKAIEQGALWRYCRDTSLYRCPNGYPPEMINYAIVDSMNGYPQPDNTRGRGKVEHFIVKRISQIFRPKKRAVFIDEGWITPDSFAVHYDQQRWWDSPPVRHNDGTTLSFADGHSEYWQWKGPDTIELGRLNDRSRVWTFADPNTNESREDLHRLQIAVWTELGYTP